MSEFKGGDRQDDQDDGQHLTELDPRDAFRGDPIDPKNKTRWEIWKVTQNDAKQVKSHRKRASRREEQLELAL